MILEHCLKGHLGSQMRLNTKNIDKYPKARRHETGEKYSNRG